MSNKLKIFTNLKLKTKLQLSFLLVGLLSVSITGWQGFENAREALEKITFDRLTSIRETKKRQIETYFQQIRNQVVTLAENRMVTEATKEFIKACRDLNEKYHHDNVLDSLRKYLQQPKSSNASVVFAEYNRIHKEYHSVFDGYLKRFRYNDIFIVDVKSGTIVYSVLTKMDFGLNLLDGPFRNSNIASAFNNVKSSSQIDYTKLVDFEPYAASNSIPASFIATPIYDADKIIGVLIFQVSINDINQVMTSNNNWKDEGLGETGETYIVGSDYKMRTDSRFFIQVPDEYFHRLVKIGTDANIVQRIKSQATSILLQEVHTVSTVEALKGITNTKIVEDYRGIPVLSSFTPLNIPGVTWAIIAEIDASEAFNSVYTLRERLILLGLVILLLAATLGVIISRTILKPILSLTKATEKFGKGDLSHRASVVTNDEIGILAATFNKMADSRAENINQLQNEIAERKRAVKEVKTSRERLRNLSAHLQTVREEERKRIAREIHDELGQTLTILKLNLTLLREDLSEDNPKITEKISPMINLIDTTIKSVKEMITSLRPRLLDDLGLTAALEWQVDDFRLRTGIECTVSIHPEEIVTDSERSTAIFRTLQETLTNIARHARATKVDVTLYQSDNIIELRVEDNGRGITQEELSDPKSFGLLGMRERAYYWGGSVDIQGAKNEGTVVIVKLPLKEKEIK
jgi:signal transduction histidine kinase